MRGILKVIKALLALLPFPPFQLTVDNKKKEW